MIASPVAFARWWKPCLQGVVTVLLFGLLGWSIDALQDVGLIQSLEALSQDLRLATRSRYLPTDGRLLIVAQDAASQQLASRYMKLEVNDWQISRQQVSQALDWMSQQAPRYVLMDYFYRLPTQPAWDSALSRSFERYGDRLQLVTLLTNRLSTLLKERTPQQQAQLANLCRYQGYQHTAPDPEWLPWLFAKALPATLPTTPKLEKNSFQGQTYCQAVPLIAPFRLPQVDFGITRVEYDATLGLLRSVPLVYRGYQGQWYPYAALQASLALGARPTVTITPDGIATPTKKIPATTPGSWLVGWRDPAIVAAKERQQAQLTVLREQAVPRLLHASPQFLITPATLSSLIAPPSGPTVSGATRESLASWLYPQSHHWQPAQWIAHHQPAVLQQVWLTRLAKVNGPLQATLIPTIAHQSAHDLWDRYLTSQPSPSPLRSAQEQAFWLGGRHHRYRSVPLLSVLLHQHNPHQPLPTELGQAYQIPFEPRSGFVSLHDRLIVMGDTLRDVHSTPVDSSTFGPDILATVWDSLLSDTQYARQLPQRAILAISLLLAMASVVLLMQVPQFIGGGLACLALLIGYAALSWGLAVWNGLLLPVTLPVLGSLVASVVAASIRYQGEEKERRQIERIYGRYVSPQLMTTILKNPSHALESLKGRRQELTVLFADIRNFTSLLEHQEPEFVSDFLNDYFDQMTRIILDHGGTLDKYIGDAIMAFFGAPVPLPNHAQAACQAAQQMQQALVAFNNKWQGAGLPVLEQSIGISTGPMMVGNFGSQQIVNFTVMGHHVNVGARLEKLTRQLNYPVLLSEATAQAIGTDGASIASRFVGQHPLKGLSHPVPVYRLASVSQDSSGEEN